MALDAHKALTLFDQAVPDVIWRSGLASAGAFLDDLECERDRSLRSGRRGFVAGRGVHETEPAGAHDH